MTNLKNAVVIAGLLLASAIAQAQDKYINVYVPMYTAHLDQRDIPGWDYHDGYLGSEGGQGGAIVSLNYPNGKTITAGVMQNSWGDFGAVASVGKHWGNRFKYGYEAGILTGYRKSWKRNMDKNDEETGTGRPSGALINLVMATGIHPMITGVLSYEIIDSLRVKTLINPTFFNLGLSLKL